jgi:hypothetical protein
MKFRKRPVIIDAIQWYTNGDHPDDGEDRFTEGRIVRRYRNPIGDGNEFCQYCNSPMHVHGWIDTLEGGHIVCPGDWVITGIQGEHYPCKDDIFRSTYEPVDEEAMHAFFGDEIDNEIDCVPFRKP